eukprot:1136203-Pelagomonas_calceolata.AAC.4
MHMCVYKCGGLHKRSATSQRHATLDTNVRHPHQMSLAYIICSHQIILATSMAPPAFQYLHGLYIHPMTLPLFDLLFDLLFGLIHPAYITQYLCGRFLRGRNALAPFPICYFCPQHFPRGTYVALYTQSLTS